MFQKFLSCFLFVSPSGVVARSEEKTYHNLDTAQFEGEYELPSLTMAMAPAKVILMIREVPF